MKREELFEVLGDIDENHVMRAREPVKSLKKPLWPKIAAIAACVCVIIAGFVYGKISRGDFNSVITSHGGVVDTVAEFTYVPVGDRLAGYERVRVDSEKLRKYIGDEYLSADGVVWYYPAGADNLKYLIRQTEDGGVTLWVFVSFVVMESSDGEDASFFAEAYPGFDFSIYTYGDVYEIIYGVSSAEDIVSITASPSNANNTDFGKEIQKEIGTHTYTDREDIENFYAITAGVVCHGDSNEREFYDVGYRFTYSFSTDEQDKLTSGESIYGTRFLKITLSDGTTIDSWKYNALSGYFYEFGGIWTEALTADDVNILNDIFGIR